MSKIVTAEEWRRERNLLEIHTEGLELEFSMKFFQISGHDKAGRPLLFLRIRNYFPKQTSEENIQKFFTYFLDQACVR